MITRKTQWECPESVEDGGDMMELETPPGDADDGFDTVVSTLTHTHYTHSHITHSFTHITHLLTLLVLVLLGSRGIPYWSPSYPRRVSAHLP